VLGRAHVLEDAVGELDGGDAVFLLTRDFEELVQRHRLHAVGALALERFDLALGRDEQVEMLRRRRQ